jgi:pimeloyl-ACP methyl ester carboxylesterase
MTITAASSDPIFEAAGTVEINGATLAYRETGAGEPVVFVHGGLSDLRTWQQQLPAIGDRYRAISYSRRYARPNLDIEPGSDDQMLPHVDDLATFLRALDAAPAHLVGNSWGGFICLLTALRHPELVRTLVVEEPPVIPLVIGDGARPQPGAIARGLLRHPRATLSTLRWGGRSVAPLQKAFRRGDDEQALKTFVHGVLGREAYEQLPETRKQQMRENLRALKAQMLGAGFPPLSDADVCNIRVPTLLLTGEHSPSFLLRLTDVLEQLLPLATRVEISAASHAMHEENAAAVNAAILAFLNRQRRDAFGRSRPIAVA